MGLTTSLPQLIGSLATKIFCYLTGSNYNHYISDRSQETGAMARWRGRDHLVYQKMG